MTRSALEWGTEHKSCEDGLAWRKSLGPDATQADAWRLCCRGTWMFWALQYLSPATLSIVIERMLPVFEKILRRDAPGALPPGAVWRDYYRVWARENEMNPPAGPRGLLHATSICLLLTRQRLLLVSGLEKQLEWAEELRGVLPAWPQSAAQWGAGRGSCLAALTWRRSLGEDATQADAWLACQRGDWVIWCLWRGATEEQLQRILPELAPVIEEIVRRDCCGGHVITESPRTEYYKRWARAHMSVYTDHNYIHVAAARLALWVGGYPERANAAAMLRQAEEIRAAVPEWPGEL